MKVIWHAVYMIYVVSLDVNAHRIHNKKLLQRFTLFGLLQANKIKKIKLQTYNREWSWQFNDWPGHKP